MRDIIAANPGMSVQEALIKLHTINMQTQQALLAGLAPPVAVAGPIATVAPAAIAALAPPPMMMMAGAQPIGGALTKAQREIYVGNLPPGVTVPHLFDFVNVAMRQLGINSKAPAGSVVSAWVSTDGHYAFVELRAPEEANAVMAYLSGLQLGLHSLKVGRPKGVGPNGMVAPLTQTPFTAAMLGLGPHPGGVPTLGGIPMPPMPASMAHLQGLAGSLSGAVASVVNSTDTDRLSNVVMATNLPLSLSEHQIEELFSPFGKIKVFNVIPDSIGSAKSTSVAFEYEDPSITDSTIQGLNGLDIGGMKLSLQRVPQGMASVLLRRSVVVRPPLPPVPRPNPLLQLAPTCALQLSNMVLPEDLRDEQLYEELMEDVADELNSHGTVRSIVIPRPRDANDISGGFSAADIAAGVSKIFVLFLSAEGAQKARAAVHGRIFNGNKVEALFYPEEMIQRKVYSIPPGFDPLDSKTWYPSNADDSSEDNEPLD